MAKSGCLDTTVKQSKEQQMYQVQVRKVHGKWTTRYTAETENRAIFWFNGLNTWGDYRKRLLDPNGKVLYKQAW